MNESAKPIFVRGLSRSGGTLLVTILDAHPDIAMSYELYPSILELPDGSRKFIKRLAKQIRQAPDLTKAGREIENRNLRQFVLRCARGGLDSQRLAALLREHAAERDSFDVLQGRFRFIERCCLAKMNAAGKSRWGLKCTSHYEEYRQMWPEAYFLNIVRDGRDVLASQLNTGAFDPSPADLGWSWSKTHLDFRELIKDPKVNALEVRYEQLVAEPEPEIRKISEFLGVEFDPSMLAFYSKDLTIFSANHISMPRISKAIDASKVGRWRNDLSRGQLDAFYRTAREAMITLGYLSLREAEEFDAELSDFLP